jgi:hypothetical protein
MSRHWAGEPLESSQEPRRVAKVRVALAVRRVQAVRVDRQLDVLAVRATFVPAVEGSKRPRTVSSPQNVFTATRPSSSRGRRTNASGWTPGVFVS